MKKICSASGCPTLVDKPKRLCPIHQAKHEVARGTRTERGAGADHQRARKLMAPKVEAGLVDCCRCGKRIEPGQRWAADHNDRRDGYLGASHYRCNARAGGLASHGLPFSAPTN